MKCNRDRLQAVNYLPYLWGGLPYAGCQMPTHPAILTIFNRRGGGNKIKKLVGEDKNTWLEPGGTVWNQLLLVCNSPWPLLTEGTPVPTPLLSKPCQWHPIDLNKAIFKNSLIKIYQIVCKIRLKEFIAGA